MRMIPFWGDQEHSPLYIGVAVTAACLVYAAEKNWTPPKKKRSAHPTHGAARSIAGST
jgi:hypothetical protein